MILLYFFKDIFNLGLTLIFIFLLLRKSLKFYKLLFVYISNNLNLVATLLTCDIKKLKHEKPGEVLEKNIKKEAAECLIYLCSTINANGQKNSLFY